MEWMIDKQKKLAQVWMSRADQENVAKQEMLGQFIAHCRARKIFVCVYRSGDGDLLENTKELLAYNYAHPVVRDGAR